MSTFTCVRAKKSLCSIFLDNMYWLMWLILHYLWTHHLHFSSLIDRLNCFSWRCLSFAFRTCAGLLLWASSSFFYLQNIVFFKIYSSLYILSCIWTIICFCFVVQYSLTFYIAFKSCYNFRSNVPIVLYSVIL